MFVRARGPGRCFANLLHCRKQQADEHSDDSDDHQEFDERKATPGESHGVSRNGVKDRPSFYHRRRRPRGPIAGQIFKPITGGNQIARRVSSVRRMRVLAGATRPTFLRGGRTRLRCCRTDEHRTAARARKRHFVASDGFITSRTSSGRLSVDASSMRNPTRVGGPLHSFSGSAVPYH